MLLANDGSAQSIRPVDEVYGEWIFNDRPLSEVFQYIEQKTNYQFSFFEDVNLNQRITIARKNQKLSDLLVEISGVSNLAFKQVNNTISIRSMLNANDHKNEVARSVRTITGKVTSADDKGGLPGVNVMVKGTTQGTVTDVNGDYKIEVPDNGAVLVFSSIGFLSEEIAVGENTAIDVILTADIQTLGEVVVVGYGNQARKDVTGAVGTVKSESVRDLPAASADQRMAGQLAGVQVNQSTGAPGGGVTIRVRGSGSIGAGDDPLYVIDGFPVSNTYGQSSNPLAALNPNDIESITVLKDASATAIYGSRGASGVILVTTKKAKPGTTTVEVSSYVGFQRIADRSKVTMMTAEEFARFRTEARQDLAAFQGVPFDPNTVPEVYRNPQSLGAGTNWFDEVTRTAPMQNYNITLSKGTETTRTLFSAGYFDQDGTVVNTGFKRYSLRTNLEFDPYKNVTIGVNLNPSYVTRQLATTEGHFNDAVLTQSLLMSPLSPAYQPDGSYTVAVGSGDTFVNANPLSILNQTTNKAAEERILANTFIDVEPIPGLHLKSTFNVDQKMVKLDYFKPSYVGTFRIAPTTPTASPATGRYSNNLLLNWLNENTISYEKQVGEHRFDMLAGYTVQQERYESTVNNGTQYALDAVTTINGATNITVTNTSPLPTTEVQKWRLQSYLARLNYAFKDRYLLSAAIRRDGSSRFSPKNRWSQFPSVSAGWRISDEPFFPQTPAVSDVKLRVAYGLSGNNNIPNYAYMSTLVMDNYTFNGAIASGVGPGTLPNDYLGWEESRQLDIGLDASFLSGRINLIFEIYKRQTESMLWNINVPAASGFLNGYTNLGKVENKGIEITLNTRNTTGAIKWETDFNISFNRNKVLDLGPNKQIISGAENTNISVVGKPMGLFYGYKFQGLFQTQAELNSSPKQAGQTALGSVRYDDYSGNGVIDAADKQPIGSPMPNFAFGMTNRFTYKNFDLSILINGSQGGKIMDLYKRFTTNIDGVFNVSADVKDRWRSPEQPGNGKIATTNGSTSLAREINSLWVVDASYLSVRNVTLGYRFKTSFADGLRAYASIQNALLLSPYKGGWPEINTNGNNSLAPGVNYTGYPVPTTYTLGVNVTLKP
jgi:TonB-linked SusC/RagA family outer membrane protein